MKKAPLPKQPEALLCWQDCAFGAGAGTGSSHAYTSKTSEPTVVPLPATA